MGVSQTSDTYGLLFYFGDPGGTDTNYSQIGEVTSLEPPKIEVSEIETTHLLSDSKFEESIPGFLKSGEAKVGVNFISATYGTVNGLLPTATSRGIIYWKMIYPSSLQPFTLKWKGYIKELMPPKFEKNKALGAEFTVKALGPVIYSSP